MFSSRVPRDLTPNALARRAAAHRASGRPLLDLTVTNPTAVGIAYPHGMLACLSDRAAFTYEPEPFGLAGARAAVASDYARRGTTVAPERVVLTASTSEAYSVLFKLLCDPGDNVLAPVPSYPLFDHLSRLDGLTTSTYRLEYHGRWMVDAHSVDDSWTDRTRAVLAVTPNNPTGSLLSAEETRRLAARCRDRNAALVVDEVFIDYPLGSLGPWVPGSVGPSARADGEILEPTDRGAPGPPDPGTQGPLCFRLGGLSKSAGLPQVKLGWIAVEGPDHLVADALQRLEIICDTYLSVSTPVQIAAPDLIAQGAAVRASILERIRSNWCALGCALSAAPSTELLKADGGWSAVVRVPSTRTEEDWVLELLEQDGVLVHPGYFFDMPHEAFLVLSLLPPAADFQEAVRRLTSRIDA